MPEWFFTAAFCKQRRTGALGEGGRDKGEGVEHLRIHREQGLKNRCMEILPSKQEMCFPERFILTVSWFKGAGETISQQLSQEVADPLL